MTSNFPIETSTRSEEHGSKACHSGQLSRYLEETFVNKPKVNQVKSIKSIFQILNKVSNDSQTDFLWMHTDVRKSSKDYFLKRAHGKPKQLN